MSDSEEHLTEVVRNAEDTLNSTHHYVVETVFYSPSTNERRGFLKCETREGYTVFLYFGDAREATLRQEVAR